MGGLTHTNGDINCCKWLQALDAWLQFEVDLILFSEMQPSIVTSDTPAGLYTLDYNPEHTHTHTHVSRAEVLVPLSTAVSSNLAQNYTFQAPLANQASGSTTSHTLL